MTVKTNTKQQERKLNDIIDFLTKGYVSEYEVKELEVKKSEDWRDVYVSMTIGRVGDEGTLAECICRDHYQFFIGPRGGMFYYGESTDPKYFSKYEMSKVRW